MISSTSVIILILLSALAVPIVSAQCGEYRTEVQYQQCQHQRHLAPLLEKVANSTEFKSLNMSGIHSEIVDNPAWTDGRVGKALGEVIAGLICLFSQDRSKFTTSFVSRVFAESGFSVAMINSQIKHEAGGYCLKGSTFLSKGVVFFPYDVYLFNKPGGFVVNLADGGYINWAYYGYFQRDGMRITSTNYQ